MAGGRGRKDRRGTTRKKRTSGSTAIGRLMSAVASFLFGRPLEETTRARFQEIKGLFLIALAIWLALSLASFYAPPDDPGADGRNWGGDAGFYLAEFVLKFVGLGGYLVTALVLAWGLVIVARKQVSFPMLRLAGAVCFVLSVAFMLQMGLGPLKDSHGNLWYEQDSPWLAAHVPFGPGGWLALTWTDFFVQKFGAIGLWVVLGLFAVTSFMLATEMAFYPAFCAFADWLRERRERRDEDAPAAILGWTKRLLLGLWDFLRGADLVAETVPPLAVRRAASGKTAAKAAKPAVRAAQRQQLAEDEEEEEDEEEDEEEEEYEEDEEEEYEDEDEYEYEDEDDEEELDEEEEEEEEDEDEDDEDEEEEDEDDEEDDDLLDAAVVVPAASRKQLKLGSAATSRADFEPPTPPPGPWTLPPLELLERPSAGASFEEAKIEEAARKLEGALRSFRVDAEVVAAQVGPAVTLFELTIAEGTRMNKVTQLSQEIAATLRAKSVRIIAPIPGKATIGIEVPNKERRVVRLSELVTQKAYDKKAMPLPLFLGMDAEGNAIVEDLARMPHLLIAGTTGSGKSVCINCILASLLLTRSPHDVQMILVDPKMVELQIFSTVPHLMLPVVTDARQATNVLLWAVEKMEGRYELFRNAGVKNIKGFNQLGEEELRKRLGDNWNEERTPRHVPYIVVVIDEMADLMMVAKKEAELAITRLAQKSRAVGIHVIVATQRPSTDVITGVLKGNLPTRIAFQVASKIDSRVILDASGAEKLLGGGDMLYTPPQSSQLRRVQGALVEDHELQALIDFICKDAVPNFNQELVQTATGTPAAGGVDEGGPDDPLWDEAVRVILKTRRGSASLLQRALGVGYTRASRLIDLMTQHGIVGEHKGSKSREILITLEDWEEMNGVTQGIPGDE